MQFDPSVYFEQPKPVAVLTNTLTASMMEKGNSLYSNRNFKKHVLVKDQILQRFAQHEPGAVRNFIRGNMTLEGVEGLNLRSALDHLHKEHRYEMILVEAGASTTVPCYSERH